jgi:hypothetical protein
MQTHTRPTSLHRVPFVLLLATLGACVSTGSIAETQMLTADVKSFAVPQITVVAADAEWQKDASEFQKVLGEKLQAGAWKAGGAPVTCEVTFKAFDKGSKGMRMMLGGAAGDAELTAEVVLKDGAGQVLAKLDAVGNSKRQSTTSVGGYDTSWGDSLPGRAVRALADQIVEYFETKKKPG